MFMFNIQKSHNFVQTSITILHKFINYTYFML